MCSAIHAEKLLVKGRKLEERRRTLELGQRVHVVHGESPGRKESVRTDGIPWPGSAWRTRCSPEGRNLGHDVVVDGDVALQRQYVVPIHLEPERSSHCVSETVDLGRSF